MTPEAMAALHAACFADAPPPWSAEAFAGLLSDKNCFAVTGADGLALGRLAGPEAELLTLAVAPGARRSGLGLRLLAELEQRARHGGSEEIFLEVAVDNRAARTLYDKAGYRQTGLRRGYYRPPARPPVDALVLIKSLV